LNNLRPAPFFVRAAAKLCLCGSAFFWSFQMETNTNTSALIVLNLSEPKWNSKQGISRFWSNPIPRRRPSLHSRDERDDKTGAGFQYLLGKTRPAEMRFFHPQNGGFPLFFPKGTCAIFGVAKKSFLEKFKETKKEVLWARKRLGQYPWW
jgi:hypothetical protein